MSQKPPVPDQEMEELTDKPKPLMCRFRQQKGLTNLARVSYAISDKDKLTSLASLPRAFSGNKRAD
jgi:hypothetical protein